MNVTIRKIGNSEGVIIPKEVLHKLGLKSGDTLRIIEVDGSIQLTPEPADLTEQLRAARLGMQKYRTALRELAK
jgi:putative addiction module antidote